MGEKTINEVFAENLAALMARRGVNQSALSAMCKVSQKTVSNYLNPGQRVSGSKGKTPSAKLTELAMMADALDVEAWQLLRPLDPEKRRAFELLEAAFKLLQPKSTAPLVPVLVAKTKAPRLANGRSS